MTIIGYESNIDKVMKESREDWAKQNDVGFFEAIFRTLGPFRYLYDMVTPDTIQKSDVDLRYKFEDEFKDPVGQFMSGYFGAYLSDEMLLWLAVGAGSILITSIVIIALKWIL